MRQPKGKGKRRYNAMIEMDEQRYDHVYFGGKGKSKGKVKQRAKDSVDERTQQARMVLQ